MHSAHAMADLVLQKQRDKMVAVLQRQRHKNMKRAVFQVLQQRMRVSETPLLRSWAALLTALQYICRCLPPTSK